MTLATILKTLRDIDPIGHAFVIISVVTFWVWLEVMVAIIIINIIIVIIIIIIIIIKRYGVG